jgi:hypothetical protein
VTISDNPLLGPQWEPLGHVLMRLVEQLRRGGRFSVQTYGRKYNLSPDTSPYLQAIVDEDGNVQMEVSANLQVNPPLTEDQYNTLEFYGWAKPESDPGEYSAEGGNPNFVRYFEPNTDALLVAEFILTTLIGVYEITEDDYFGFDHAAQANLVDSLHKLGRLKYSDGNPDRVIFAMPGKHLEALGADETAKDNA